MKYKFIISIILLGSLSVVSGCGTKSVKKDAVRESSKLPSQSEKRHKKGFYYMVEEGETLSKIAKNYEVSVERISNLNHLPDDNKIKPGQLLFIPKSPTVIKEDQRKIHFIWPVKGEVVKLFNKKKKKGKINLGIDIKFSPKQKIIAAEKGEVVFCSDSPKFNLEKNLVILNHKGGFNSVYIMEGKILVGVHKLVKRGKPILEAGDKSNNILHFEIRRNHVPKNPYYYLP